MTAATAARPPQIPGYQYVSDIATGGYSVVYRYRQRSPRRDVAVKVLTDFDDAPVAPQRRDAEADMMAQLGNHPNIVQVIAADVTPDGRHYIVMPYYPGRSLAEIVAEGPLSVGKVLRVGASMASALDAAHRLGLLHRDVKPANILIDEYGTPRLTDFGIAGWAGVAQRDDAGGMSLPWSPPEVVAGGENLRASDIYSLGATLFHLLVGQPPHARASDTRAALEQRIQTTQAPPTGRDDVPEALERLIARMLAGEPHRRPDSASLVAAELRDVEAVRGGAAVDGASWHVTRPRSARRATQPPPSNQAEPQRNPETQGMAESQRLARTVLRDRPLLQALAPAGGHTIRIEPGSPAPAAARSDVETTWRRPGGPPAGTAPEPEVRRTRGSQWVLVGAATIAVAVIVAGIVWSSSGTKAPSPSPSGGNTNQNALLNEVPPGAVMVTGQRSGAHATFTWTYDGAQVGDTFLWRVEDSTTTTAASKPTVTIDDPPGTQVCIQVRVVRPNGTGSPDWSPAGCAR